MENRFQRLREEYSEQRRDKDPTAKIYSQREMYEEMIAAGFKVSFAKIKKIESEQYGVEVDAETLRAYKWKFDVSADWLIDTSVKTKKITGTVASASKVTGLSDEAIEEISKLNSDYKKILDKMISRYCLLSILAEIRNLLGYNYLKPHLVLKFDETRKLNSGAEIDQFLHNAINDNAVSSFFNETISKSMKNIVDNTMNDTELKEYFGEKDKTSKIWGTTPWTPLPKIGDL